ncbi:MAG: ATP-binding cassette domain-containing protein, partial [Anaerolineae bacterium]|nr:ATP-binding cassette domain-containing protein [Anaerolineae bacterium]
MTLLLQVNHATKVFASGAFRKKTTVALDGVSLSLPTEPAQVIAIAGESGSGKTTLARLVLGFIAPTVGQVLYKGQD